MTMPPGNVIPSDKMQFPMVAAAGGQWIPDEREGFISWLRSEFAAANAIVDLLCQHLRAVGDPGEYDSAIAAINQRRLNWTPVLHMQQYFSVAEVAYTLQQIAWKKQQKQNQQHRGSIVDHQGKFAGNDIRRSGVGFNKHDRIEKSEEAKSGGGNVRRMTEHKGLSVKIDDKRGSAPDASSKPNADTSSKSSENSEALAVANGENRAGIANCIGTSNSKENESASDENQNEMANVRNTPKTFVATEIYDGKPVNVVDGLELYEELLDSDEVSKLVSMVNDLRVSGKRGHLKGHTYTTYKRPMKGHGREMIQLGLPIVDAPVDDQVPAGASRDHRVEPIPSFLQDVIERVVSMQIMPVKPDSCIINFYNEGDHSQPYMFFPCFGRPVCLVFFSECDMTFGRVIVSDHPGDYKGSIKLSLMPGSLLVMQGKSADFSKHAIDSIGKQRVIITFTKSQPKKSFPSLAHSSLAPPSHWVPPHSRSPNHVRNPSAQPTRHYTSVLPPTLPQIPQPNGIQPIFGPVSVTPVMPFPGSAVSIPPASTGWPVIVPPPPRHPPPRIPFPGTGVFLPPPGSSNPPNTEAGSLQEKEGGSGKPDHGDSTSESKLDERVNEEQCNGQVVEKEEERQSSS